MNFGEAYLSYVFCNLICPCGERFGNNDLATAAKHWSAGHYKEQYGEPDRDREGRDD